jgi:hypothetical protein
MRMLSIFTRQQKDHDDMVYGVFLTATTTDGELLTIDMATNDQLECSCSFTKSRTDAWKRIVIPDPDDEQASKRLRLEGDEGEGQATAAAAAVTAAEELKYEEELNQDSASSDEDEEIDETKIRYRYIAPDDDKKDV